jgi:hypothetical protein
MVKFFMIFMAFFLLVACTQAAEFSEQIPAHFPAQFKILQGFKDKGGSHLILELKSDDIQSNNTVFIGSPTAVHQLELTWDNANETERSLIYVAEKAHQDGELTIEKTFAELREMGRSVAFQRMNAQELLKTQHQMNEGRVQVKMLPAIWKSKYLFQVPNSDELVLVKEPVFNFHGNYRVFTGRSGRLHEILVERSTAQEIRFKNGGGLYIPVMTEILSASETRTATHPSLIRSRGANIESLILPKLSSKELAILGFSRSRKS